MTLLRVILLVAFGLTASLLGALFLFQRHLIYPGAFGAGLAEGERRVPAGTEAVAVTTADGRRLYGLWRAPEPGHGVVLTFHGNGSLPEPHAARFSSGVWREAGWGTLAIAYGGYPGSAGSPSEASLIEDGMAAYRFVRDRAPDAPILLHGHSMGAAVTVAVAAREPHLGLYLEAPFVSLARLVAEHFPLLPGLLLRDTWRSDRRIGAAAGRILIVHGTDDPVIPVAHGRDLAALAGTRARFVAVPGDHVSLLGQRDAEAEATFRPVRSGEPNPAMPR
ncbi:alpha/beta hydrolase [Methylobacterium sp. E-045]|uniref:alpha/beta hydrolase n=1 Tax=Methylobacterium sp. E-045 TaxID=2836575 RepID=UPI001FB8FEF0|nr:alpha/beta hydrolase [Methylobacterium sp. E-045]MCJ2130957.1 alpha/beta hydrolase [Methylobacterium sp. E-045]